MKTGKPGTNTSHLRGLLKHGAKEYTARKAAAEAQVVRREFYSDDAVNARPFYFERFEMTPGRPLKQRTPNATEHGFDAKGRLVLLRSPSDDEDPASEEFFAYHPDRVESINYRLGKGTPLYASIQRFNKGRILECDVMDVKPPSEFDERYFYKGDRLVEIQATHIQPGTRTAGRWDVQYDSAGRFRCLRRFDDAYDLFFVIHWNPATAPKFDELVTRIRKRLVQLVPEVVRKSRIKDRAFAVALAYDWENDPLPPYIGVGLESERQHWLSSKGKEAKAFLWNPAEYKRYEDGTLNLSDKELEEDCEILCQLILAKSDTWSAQKLLNGATMELNKRDWSKVLPVTEDFVVYAVDLEGAHLKPNMKAAVPAQTLAMLRKRKLI